MTTAATLPAIPEAPPDPGLRRWAPALLALLVLTTGGCRCDGRGQTAPPTEGAADGGGRPVTDRAGEQGPSWGPLPVDPLDLDQRIGRYTRRPVSAEDPQLGDVGPEPTADRLLALLRGRFRDQRVRCGWPAITGWLDRTADDARRRGRDSYLLWGVYHDSAPQHAAFRRLIGPLGLESPLHIVAEPFDADGRWSALPATAQRGDDGALSRYLHDGATAALHELAARQREDNYTAWKYGYLDEVMDLLVTARSAGRQVWGCDLPRALQRELRPALGRHTEKLRELHCALALRDRLATDTPPHQVAMLWGQGHLGAGRFERFLPEDAEVLSIRVFGGRPVEHDAAVRLRRRLSLSAPLLVPTDERDRRFVLLLAKAPLRARVDRVREPVVCPLPVDQQQRLRVSSTVAGTFHIGAAELELHAEPRSVALSAGIQGYLFEGDQIAMAGSLPMPRDGQLTMDLDPVERTMALTIHRCAEPADGGSDRRP